jgi:hypothetical protein
MNTDLLFAWEPPRARRFAITGFLALSTAAHACCFYLFQIVYPPTVALLPPPARVNFVSENSDEGRTLLRWVSAEDPALTTTTQRSPEARAFALPKLAHVPSYITFQPALKPWPHSVADDLVPSAQPPAPVPVFRPTNRFAHTVAPTSVVFPENYSLGKLQTPAMKFSASTRESPQGAKFRIAIDASGVIRYCFLQTSSGDAGLDEQGRAYLLLCRFATDNSVRPADSAKLNWTTATIEWGNDVAMPAAPAQTSP